MNIKKFSFDDKLLIAVCIFCIAALLIPPLDFIKTWVLRLGYGIGCAGILYLTVCTTVFRKGVKNVKLKIGAAISLLLFVCEWMYFLAVSRPSGTLPTVYLLAASVLLLFWIMILGQKYRKNKE
ncbi:MAG: hypothetical protein KHY62_03835 [Firmicutes bacterium]|nr:hypothetical protein [Bacillota bacterium]